MRERDVETDRPAGAAGDPDDRVPEPVQEHRREDQRDAEDPARRFGRPADEVDQPGTAQLPTTSSDRSTITVRTKSVFVPYWA